MNKKLPAIKKENAITKTEFQAPLSVMQYVHSLVIEGNKKSTEIVNRQEGFAKKAEKILGYRSTMLGSKSRYSDTHPRHLVVFNSNVCTKNGKIWWGDLDITLSKDKILELSKAIKEDVYVLYEMDARFENEEKPKLEKAVFVAKKDGTFLLGEYYKVYRGKIMTKSEKEMKKVFKRQRLESNQKVIEVKGKRL